MLLLLHLPARIWQPPSPHRPLPADPTPPYMAEMLSFSTLVILVHFALYQPAHAQYLSNATSTATVTSTSIATPRASPCPSRSFPMHDVIGTVINETFQRSEAACSQSCCALDLCAGYSFNGGTLGAATISEAPIRMTTVTNGALDGSGTVCGDGSLPAGSLMQSALQSAGACNCGWYPTSLQTGGTFSPARTAPSLSSPPATRATRACTAQAPAPLATPPL